MTTTRLRVTKGVVALATLAYLAILGGILYDLGFAWDRVAILALVGGVGLVGPVGVFVERPYVAAGGACALLVLGFTQPVLWMVLHPLAGVLVVAALVVAAHDGDEREAGPEDSQRSATRG